MDPNRQQITERLKTAKNILVTVSSNPTVDQLSACIGLALFINKQGKHGTAVYSGVTPSTIEFLQPEATLEKNTDSLRDFIIALDKSKADRLRYKVEDNVVKIFITPYHTSLSEKDLVFSQGDLNTDTVIALGVRKQADLDKAIVSHGRILHDATVISINASAGGGELGAINWNDPKASSLCEMITTLAAELDAKSIDAQIATALLTGIVAQTARFSNDKTSPVTMDLAAKLMGSGANQQLIATNLEEKPATPDFIQPKAPMASSDEEVIEKITNNLKNGTPAPQTPDPNDGSLQVAHSPDDLDLRMLNRAKQEQPQPPMPALPPLPPVEPASTAVIDIPEPEPKPPEPPRPRMPEPLPMPEPPKPKVIEPPMPPPKSVPLPPKPELKPLASQPEPEIPKVVATPVEPPAPEPDLPPIIKKDRQEPLLREPPKPQPNPEEPGKKDEESFVSDPLSTGGHPTPILSHDSADKSNEPGVTPISTENASLEEARQAVLDAVGSAPLQPGEDPLAALGIKPIDVPVGPPPKPIESGVQPHNPEPAVLPKVAAPTTNSRGDTLITDSSSLEKLLKKSEEGVVKKAPESGNSTSPPPPPVPPPIYPL